VKDKHLCRAGLGLEAALASRGGGVEVIWTFGEILLLFLVILADEEAAILERDGENNVGAECVFANEPIKVIGRQRDALVLLQLGPPRGGDPRRGG